MKSVLHAAQSRGYFDHGWLKTHHTFSFARYYDPARINFGALRVLNDDVVAGGEGFGTHPHDNMEIVSIPLEGVLRHGDSMGNSAGLAVGQIQVMTAGTGVTHSEMNDSAHSPVKFLQIWIFPDREHLLPRYGDFTLPPARANQLRTIVTPEGEQTEGLAWIHQNAWLHTLDLKRHDYRYQMRGKDNGLYVFVLDGEATIAGEDLSARDGIGVWETPQVDIHATGQAQLLLIEVPMYEVV